jgi:D-glycero-D-manno-heptose 1,7-bisphosphate phosphatase
MNQKLQSSFSFTDIVYCLHDDRDNCQCRKPKPGMLNNLIARYNIDKDKAIILGDREKDILAGQAAGIKTVYFKDKFNQMPSCHPDFVINKLNDMLGILKTY